MWHLYENVTAKIVCATTRLFQWEWINVGYKAQIRRRQIVAAEKFDKFWVPIVTTSLYQNLADFSVRNLVDE